MLFGRRVASSCARSQQECLLQVPAQLKDVRMSARLAECDKNLQMLSDILTSQTLHVPHEVLWDSYAWDWTERENKVR